MHQGWRSQGLWGGAAATLAAVFAGVPRFVTESNQRRSHPSLRKPRALASYCVANRANCLCVASSATMVLCIRCVWRCILPARRPARPKIFVVRRDHAHSSLRQGTQAQVSMHMCEQGHLCTCMARAAYGRSFGIAFLRIRSYHKACVPTTGVAMLLLASSGLPGLTS